MDEHPAPPPPPRIAVHRSTTDILKRTTSIFFTRNNLLMFLILSFILLFDRFNIILATHSLTSYIDNDASIKSIIHRTHIPPNSASPTTTRRRRRHPFLQLTGVRIPDDDFSLDDKELDHRFFGSLPKRELNASSFILDSFDPQFGYSDNGIRASETVRSTAKMTFRSIEIIENDESNDSAPFHESIESKTDFRHEFTASLISIGVFSVSYGYLMLVFVFTHSLVHGITFVLVLNNFCRRNISFAMNFLNGCSLGLSRSCGFNLMKWVIRASFTLLLGAWFFAGIEYRYSVLKIFVRLIFMPYSLFVPFVKGFEKESESFILPWLLVDHLVSFLLTVDAWIVMADSRKNLREVVNEGCHLLSLMILPAIQIKSFEGFVCGPYVTWLLARTFGDLFALAFQSFMEVYFMVAWMVFYLCVKSIHANSAGQRFGQRELEAMLEDVN